MNRVFPVVVLVIAVLLVTHPTVAQNTQADIDAKLKAVDAKLAELEDLKAELEDLRDGITAAPATEEKPSWEDKVKIGGYFQTRYAHRDYGRDDFFIKQMYINLDVKPNDRTKARVQWARVGPDPIASSNTDWGDIWAQYAWSDEWSTRVGQSNNFLGLEMNQSSSKRGPLERAAVLQGGGAAPRGLQFGGLYDRGIWVIHTPAEDAGKWHPDAVIGVENGQFRARDKNNAKNIVVRLNWDRDWGQFGTTWLDGTWTNDTGLVGVPAVSRRDAIMGHVRVDPANCDWAFQGEYVDGNLLGNDIEGWYAQLEYDPSADGTAFVKYDKYNPAVGVVNNHWDCWHVGYAHWLDSNNELTVQWTNGTNRMMAPSSRDEVALQWQLGF